MTCRIQAKITYNWPITVDTTDGNSSTNLFTSEGKPGTFIGEHTYELDEWFSGNQEIKVKEIPSS
jgi:hypothetical protein